MTNLTRFNWLGRNRHWKFAAAACMLAAFAFFALRVATPMVASGRGGLSPKRPSTTSGVALVPSRTTTKFASCQKQHRLICDPAAYRALRSRLPLANPDPRNARRGVASMLTEQQAVASMNWTSDNVAAELMTYGEAHAKWPDLAAATSILIDPSRLVWVMTKYLPEPVAIAPFTTTFFSGTAQEVSAYSVVIDAVTGDETDGADDAVVPLTSDTRGKRQGRPALRLTSARAPWTGQLTGWAWKDGDGLTIREVSSGTRTWVFHVVTSTSGTFTKKVRLFGCTGVVITVRDRFGNHSAISRLPSACF